MSIIDNLIIYVKYLSPEDVVSLSQTNRELHDYITDSFVSEYIWKLFFPNFPDNTIICDVGYIELNYYLRIFIFSTNKKWIPIVSHIKIPGAFGTCKIHKAGFNGHINEKRDNGKIRKGSELFRIKNGNEGTITFTDRECNVHYFVALGQHVHKDDCVCVTYI